MNSEPITSHAFSRGQSLYYALLFAPASLQEACFGLNAFFQEITALGTLETNIAQVKLSWWREEIARTFQGLCQHPTSKQLLCIINHYDLNEAHFEQFLTAASARLSHPYWETWEDIQAHCYQMGGQKMLLMAHTMKISHPDTDTFAVMLGAALELIDRIRYFGKDLAQGKILFAKEDLAFFNIDEESLMTHYTPHDLIASLLYRQAHRARILYQKALEILPEQDRFKVASLLGLAKIYFVLLDEIEQANFDVLNQRISLTPLRKWWLAWRHDLQEKQRYRALQKLINQKVTVHG
ncbi:squalene/phytoene synthase family protein [Candidatus Berkiella aquae]|uniref:All-trans-phytoene synthase n=1 Tax=Candidatus Berkiella aquae TaxID=295108 RepID=A0A0Q9YP85_9GAMM|nr:squalene/phytoene synthase family protein [Candidatus Berkiella aquae]MCS5712030.1 squalene/phytoene synthase family protein [Candidatus Berkiella aquae]